MSALCDQIARAMASGAACEETEFGARVMTHCLYPSFDPVAVFVVKLGDGYVIHDGGDCRSVSWLHGRDEQLISRCMTGAANRYGLRVERNQLIADVPTDEWLASAIMSVANAASSAANDAVSRQARSAADRLYEQVHASLLLTYSKDEVREKPKRLGESGREYEFDFSVTLSTRSVVIDIVTPFAASISHRYRALSDSQARRRGGAFAVHDRPLEKEDAALLSQVADVVPYSSLKRGLEREFAGT